MFTTQCVIWLLKLRSALTLLRCSGEHIAMSITPLALQDLLNELERSKSQRASRCWSDGEPTQKQPFLVYKSIAELSKPTVLIVDMNTGRRMIPNAVTVRGWQTFAEPFGLFSESIWDSRPGQGSWGFCLLERLWKALKRAQMFMS